MLQHTQPITSVKVILASLVCSLLSNESDSANMTLNKTIHLLFLVLQGICLNQPGQCRVKQKFCMDTYQKKIIEWSCHHIKTKDDNFGTV